MSDQNSNLLYDPIQRPNCPICGSIGRVIHNGLTDDLYGAPGRWGFRSCDSWDCDLIWLDPLPHAEDLVRAYQNYYTHDEASDLLKKAKPIPGSWVGREYLSTRYGYPRVSEAGNLRFVTSFVGLLPKFKANLLHYIAHLHFEHGGSLLEIGCGNGDFLHGMRELGWNVAGVELDAQSVAIARKRGLDVYHGTVENILLPKSSFSAIVMNHVIEHLIDPLSALKACYDLLRPGGQIIITTPNPASLGHRLFKSNWRGLEPPRHIHLFCPASARLCIEKAGFVNYSIRTTAHCADGILRQSVLIRFPSWRRALAGKFVAAVLGGALAQLEVFAKGSSSLGGEEWLIRACRPL